MAGFDSISTSELPESVQAALAIGSRFGVGRVAALSQFESYGNENWLVEAANERRVILRRYLHSNRERVAFQLDLQQRLHAIGFPVAEALKTLAGAVTEVDAYGVWWAAFAHVDGREYNFSIEDAVQAARRLAELHLFGRSPAAAAPALVQRPAIRDCWLNAEADLQGLRDLFDGAKAEDELLYLEEWWRHVRQVWPLDRLDALPWGWYTATSTVATRPIRKGCS